MTSLHLFPLAAELYFFPALVNHEEFGTWSERMRSELKECLSVCLNNCLFVCMLYFSLFHIETWAFERVTDEQMASKYFQKANRLRTQVQAWLDRKSKVIYCLSVPPSVQSVRPCVCQIFVCLYFWAHKLTNSFLGCILVGPIAW